MIVIERFLDYLRFERNSSALTVRAYGDDLMEFAIYLTGDADAVRSIDWARVEVNDIRSWIGSLGAKGLKQSTLRRKAQSVRAFYHFLMKTGEVTRNPAREIVLAKLPKPLPNFVPPEEMEKVLGAYDEEPQDFDSVRDRLAIEILYSCGLRRSELLSLTDTSIDKARREMKVLGKRSKERVIPLPEKLLVHIGAYQAMRDAEFPGSAGGALLVCKGKPLSPGKLSSIVRLALDSTSARKKSPHTLRHSFASAMINGGADINSVKELLGHSSLGTTQIYTHLSLKEMRENYYAAHPRARDSWREKRLKKEAEE